MDGQQEKHVGVFIYKKKNARVHTGTINFDPVICEMDQ
jgi:hypothetical protein